MMPFVREPVVEVCELLVVPVVCDCSSEVQVRRRVSIFEVPCVGVGCGMRRPWKKHPSRISHPSGDSWNSRGWPGQSETLNLSSAAYLSGARAGDRNPLSSPRSSEPGSQERLTHDMTFSRLQICWKPLFVASTILSRASHPPRQPSQPSSRESSHLPRDTSPTCPGPPSPGCSASRIPA